MYALAAKLSQVAIEADREIPHILSRFESLGHTDVQTRAYSCLPQVTEVVSGTHVRVKCFNVVSQDSEQLSSVDRHCTTVDPWMRRNSLESWYTSFYIHIPSYQIPLSGIDLCSLADGIALVMKMLCEPQTCQCAESAFPSFPSTRPISRRIFLFRLFTFFVLTAFS